VEAARAGQHGKGFAVVAEEVGNLAGRSAKAAKETADLIESSIKKIREGAAVAGVTNSELAKVMEKISKVKDIVAEIASASKEQSTGLAQITEAVGQMSQGAENISRQSEEMASASEEIEGMVGELRNEVEKFRLARKEAKLGGLFEGEIPPELLQQIIRTLQAQGMLGLAGPAVAKTSAEPRSNGNHKKKGAASPAAKTLPLDADERGYGRF
jgi:methyl-accepting chemotaxis protein